MLDKSEMKNCKSCAHRYKDITDIPCNNCSKTATSIPHEQCNNCRDIYHTVWQDRRDLLDTLIETAKYICDDCKGLWNGCDKVCENMIKWNKIIEKNKEFFKGLY